MSRVGPALLALATLAACGQSGESTKAEEARLAAIYSAVIRAVGDDHAVGDKQPVVFVVSRPDAKAIPLTVQAAVVEDLTGEISVRFVDDDDEAIDGDAVGRPVKEGILLRVGPVAPSGDPVEVTVDRYVTADDQPSVAVSVRSVGDAWVAQIIGPVPASSGG